MCNLLSSAETVVSSEKSSYMRGGEGCLLPVSRQYLKPEGHYLEAEEQRHLMVRLLSCKVEVVEHGEAVESNSLSEERVNKLLRAKVSKRKLASKMADADVPQDVETRAQSQDTGGGRVALRACEVALVGSSDFQTVSIVASITGGSWARSLASSFAFCDFVSMPPSSPMNDHKVCEISMGGQKDEEVVDNPYIPGLPDSVGLLCLAHVPVAEQRLLALVSHKYRELVRSSLLLKLRHQHQMLDQWICIYASGTDRWFAFNPKQNTWRSLPHAKVHMNFNCSDRESLAAGTHLLWLGREAFNFACYKYDVISNNWERGPHMVNPRCLFGSASCRQYAFVAGGFSVGGMQLNILNSAERYDSLKGIWEPLPPINIPRQKCSGFFMDGKFYVIGGKSGNHEQLTSGEVYDPVRNSWRTIENMYSVPALMPSTEPSPPLVAVAGNELYCIESTSNLLKVYEKGTNRWKVLGPVPVRADFCDGWGLAFKALGDQLYVIGGHHHLGGGAERVAVFSWRPQPGVLVPDWQLVNSEFTGTGSFLFNCAVMAY